MSKIWPDNVGELLSKYELEICKDTIMDDLTCILCTKLMNDAYQAFCGCQYCHRCIVDYLSAGEQHCRGGKNGCTEEFLVLDGNIMRNPMLNRKILRTKVHCPNDWCSHVAELSLLDKHLRVCKTNSLECPYLSIGCEIVMIVDESVVTHIHDNALPHTQLLIDWVQNLKNEMDTLKEESRSKEAKFQIIIEEMQNKMYEQKNEIEEHRREMEEQKKEMEKQKKEIEKQKKEIEEQKDEIEEQRREMGEQKKEVEEQKKEIEEQKNEVEEQKKEMEERKKEIQSSYEDSLYKELEMKDMMTMIETIKGDNECMKAESINIKNTVDILKTECTKYQTGAQSQKSEQATKMKVVSQGDNQSTNETRDRLDTVESSIRALSNWIGCMGTVTFKVTNVNARMNTGEIILSPYFYSRTNGYKLRLGVCPGGQSDDCSVYLSVFLYICKGEFDNLLSWPCKDTFDISIINQKTLQIHRSDTFSYCSITDNLKHLFKKPKQGDNAVYGYPKFISHVDLRSIDGLIVYNTITIKCNVRSVL